MNTNYKVALESIEQARYSGAEELDLFNFRLSALPPEIGELTNLTTLNLSNNQLTTLPAEIGKLNNLTELNLHSNQLTSLPPEIGKLNNLTELDLNDNQLTTLPVEIGKLNNLTGLNLHSNQLTTLPAEIGKLNNLTGLNLHSNQLTTLPAEIGKLNNLTGLNLHSNQLMELPPEIDKLNNLTKLNLNDNQLTTLPPEVGKLNNLTVLYLNYNQLTSLPPEIGKLNNLTVLFLNDNQLTALPPEVGKLNNLTKLDLNDNQLTSLPPEIGKLNNLTELNLHSNQLTALPPEIGKLNNLTELNLHSNQLTALPAEIGKLNNLTVLYLNYNQLTSLPPEVGKLNNLTVLYLNYNQLTSLPPEVGKLNNLTKLDLNDNQLTALPPEVGKLNNLTKLDLNDNQLTSLPPEIGKLNNLTELNLHSNQLTALPPEIGKLNNLTELYLESNQLTALPPEVGKLNNLTELYLDSNQLSPELIASANQGIHVLFGYLKKIRQDFIEINEAKLVVVGEGAVGKSSLVGALNREPWNPRRKTTHGIQIKPIQITDPNSNKTITLNCWDFGGQQVYRPTHQLFFSEPAIYLVLWKPREGLDQELVKEWIKLVKYRAPEAKMLIVSTHGGPGERIADIDRQELYDLFGKDSILGFFSIDSKPDSNGICKNVAELKAEIFRIANDLPETGRKIPREWLNITTTLRKKRKAYIQLEDFYKLCLKQEKMNGDDVHLFLRISHYLGHLIHYQHDELLKDIIILKPDWLATAISFVLDDGKTFEEHGLVRFSHLKSLWNNRQKKKAFRYRNDVHPIFQRLMERFDLSYRVSEDNTALSEHSLILVAQLVSDLRPDKIMEWDEYPTEGIREQTRICKIVDADNNQSESATGLFYQLIVRLHRYSMGRLDHRKSIHWRRGLLLDDTYNGRALLEHIGNDIHITVRAPNPVTFMSVLTTEVRVLVASFWKGLRCDVMVPCITPCRYNKPGTGWFYIRDLVDSMKSGYEDQPCPKCNQRQSINLLLQSAQAQEPRSVEQVLEYIQDLRIDINAVKATLSAKSDTTIGLLEGVSRDIMEVRSRLDRAFNGLMTALTSISINGPRLIIISPAKPKSYNPLNLAVDKYKIVLCCEHSRLPLPFLNEDKSIGVYEIDFPKEWIVNIAPYISTASKVLLGLLPVVTAGLNLNQALVAGYEKQLEFGKELSNLVLNDLNERLPSRKDIDFNKPKYVHLKDDKKYIEAHDIYGLKKLHRFILEKDTSFGGLKQVKDKHYEFKWVHERFLSNY